MKTAIIFGVFGQDGIILSDYLLKKNYRIIGVSNNSIKREKNISKIEIVDISDENSAKEVLLKYLPDEIYYLAAFHHHSEEHHLNELSLFHNSHHVHVLLLMYLLEAMRKVSKKTRLFYSASSLLYGSLASGIANEESSFAPDNQYSISKLNGLLLCRYYRNKYHLFASTGILFNHESIYRKEQFISMKLIKGAVNIKIGIQDKIIIGDLSAEIDWGYAPDFIDAMFKVLSIDISDDFVIATGKTHSVQEFTDRVFSKLGLDYRDYVIEDKNLISRSRKSLIGDYSKLNNATNWYPVTSFDSMINKMLKGYCNNISLDYSDIINTSI
jgi:GDPmannose 4,6-dehydratase